MMTMSSDSSRTYSSNEKGRHAELLTQTALIANGWEVLEPVTTEPYDLAIRRKDGDRDTYYVQVKTVKRRDDKRYGAPYLVVRGTKNNGEVYTKEEADYFAAVYEGNVFLFPNREITEYWTRADQVETKWKRIDTFLK